MRVCVRSNRRLGENKALTEEAADASELDEFAEEDANELDGHGEVDEDIHEAEGSSSGMRRRHHRKLGRKVVKNLRDLV
jgi:hypothetical protein